MSLLSGVLAGGTLVPTALGAAIDDSHSPFKRAASRPGAKLPGFNTKSDKITGDWECTRGPRTKLKSGAPAYQQVCQNTNTGKLKRVKIGVGYKKAYNKAYRAAKLPEKHGGRFAADKKRPGYVYKRPASKKSRASKKS